MNVANKITAARIVLAPVLFILYFIPLWTEECQPALVYTMAVLLLCAELTDFLDGFYARKYHEVSTFGKLFDPFADVILHLTLFVCLSMSGYMPVLFLILIIYREFSMTFLRLVIIEKGIAVAARKGGKAKTMLYVLAIAYTLLIECTKRLGFSILEAPVYTTVATMLFAGCVASAYLSFIDYLVHFRHVLSSKGL
ncbi:MAG: CDP-diacylglycerol--glycerol-3-phosphate 3-phosphatidyltransferase [Spirochaetaceae bacterium]|jgi:CDP-diacylglycerol--glycerol-3-phosphate 3-phosphatidyltransferase|nr:CDP-diacylglycerol--glycerol-3-phosphate 3-phosphatidyltransferase [Spirochaetaceae bacterium]